MLSHSDKETWQDLYSLCGLILNQTITIPELINRGNAYGDKGKRILQVICILGMININHKAVNCLKEILNIYPHFAEMFDGFITTKKYILVPFLKIICERVLSNNFVGNRLEYENILKQFQQIEASHQNCYQLILQPVVSCFKDEVKFTENRGKWLFSFEKI